MTEKRLRIVIDGSAARTGATQVTRSLDDIRAKARAADRETRTLSGSIRKVGATITSVRGLIGGFIAASAISKITRYSDAWVTAESRIRLVTTSTAELTKVQGQLFRVAQDTRNDFAETVNVYARLARATKRLGVEQATVLGVSKSLAQAVTIGGGTKESTAAGLFQLSQGIAAGALRGQELNSVLEQLPRVAQTIADEIANGDVGALRKLAEEGKITSKVIIDAFVKQGAALDAEFKKMGVTFGQALTIMGNAFTKFIGQIGESTGLSSAGAGAISALAENLDVVAKVAAAAGLTIITSFGLKLAASIALSVRQLVLLEVALGATSLRAATLGSGIKYVSSAFNALTAAMARNPIGLIAVGLAAVISALTVFRNDIRPVAGDLATLNDYMSVAWTEIGSLIDNVGNKLESVASKTVSSINEILSGLGFGFEVAELKASSLLSILKLLPGVGPIASSIAGLAESSASSVGSSWRDAANDLAASRVVVEKLEESFASFQEMVSGGSGDLGGIGEASDKLAKFMQSLRDELKIMSFATAQREVETAVMKARNLAIEDGTALTKAQESAIRSLVGQIQEKEAADKAAEKAVEDFNDAQQLVNRYIEDGSSKIDLYKKASIELEVALETLANNGFKLSADEAERLWAGLEKIKDDGKSGIDELKDAIDGWGKRTSQVFADMLTGGETSFKDLSKAFLNEIIQMILYANLLKPVFASLGAAAGGGGWVGAVGNLFSGGFAKGGAFSRGDEITAFAKGGVVNKPTLFPMAKGAGLMGEAGPEAVMPLTRGPNGVLGVRNHGGGAGGGDTNIEINVNVEGGSQGAEQDEAMARRVGAAVKAEIRGLIGAEFRNAMRPGGVFTQVQ